VRWCVVLMVAKGQRPHPRRTATITLRRFIRSPRRRAREACQEFGGQAPWRS
jgi:hypothetical protein